MVSIAAPEFIRKNLRVSRYLSLPLFLLSLVLVSPAFAAGERAAVIYPNETVSLNGVQITRVTPVFPGDTVATGKGSTATIISEGTQIALPENSEVTYGKDSLTLVRNGAVVSAVNGFVAHAGYLTVSSGASSGSQFELKEDTSGTRVTARTGSLSIDDGARVARIDAGNSFVRGASSNSSALMNPVSMGTVGNFHYAYETDGSGRGGSGGGNGGGNGGRGGGPPHCRPCRPPESPIRPCHHHHDGGQDLDSDHDRGHDPDDCRCRDDGR